MIRTIIGLALITGLIASAALTAKERLSRPCRTEIFKLCKKDIKRQSIRTCLRKNITTISTGCRSEFSNKISASKNATSDKISTDKITEYKYGTDERHTLAFKASPQNQDAAILVYIHGGGWAIGDKNNKGLNKQDYFNGLGYAYTSLNYRLVPEVKPGGQAQDIADAIAYLRRNSAKLGFNRDQIILMGHSSGAHLVALISTDMKYLKQAAVPLKAVKGAILLDGSGYDVAKQMQGNKGMLKRFYDNAFTADLAIQQRLSPTSHIRQPNVSDWLVLHVATRKSSTRQSILFANGLKRNLSVATVTPVPDSTHRSVDNDAGKSGSFVAQQIEKFLKELP